VEYVWNVANLFEAIAAGQPERRAVVQGRRELTWGQFDACADSLAAYFLSLGLAPQSKVVAYLYNSPEYLETYFATFKAGLVPVNANYRYAPEELAYLLDNADAEVVVFHTSLADRLESIRDRLPAVKAWIAVTDGEPPIPDWAVGFEAVLETPIAERPARPPGGRGADDLMFLYTGGTTGMPKAVMQRQDDLIVNLGQGANPELGLAPLADPEAARQRALQPDAPRPLGLVACPLMHGTGIFSAFRQLAVGGAVALLPSRRFNAEELWDEVDRLKVEVIALVGMAFAQPMLEALEAKPGRWDLSSVRSLGSSGTMWSQENKRGLLQHCRNATILDALASSEAPGFGISQSAPGGEVATARFMMTPNSAVFTEDGRRVQPGSGERGLLAVSGRLPVGYYKDPKKTAETFRVIEGKRWSVPGDWAEIEADGTIKLLGRGSVSINTGGEKVFPEEVEEALKAHHAVRDALVVGLPDPRFGERICAVVEPMASQTPTLEELAAHVRSRLADYKVPRALVIVETMGRAPNGKADYKATKALALASLTSGAA